VSARTTPAGQPAGAGPPVPLAFNFTRDVVERRSGRAVTFVDAQGNVHPLTFPELAATAARWVGVLREWGAVPGGRIVVATGRTQSWHAIVLGALKAGSVVVHCGHVRSAAELASRAIWTRADLVVLSETAGIDAGALEEQLAGEANLLTVSQAFPRLDRKAPVTETADTQAADQAFVLYTAGATGEPKPVMHTHAWCFAQRQQAAAWLGADAGDVVWSSPGAGDATTISNALLGPWSVGAEVLSRAGDIGAEERLELIREHGVTVLCQSPDEYRALTELPGFGSRPLPKLRQAVSVGEALDPRVAAAFEAACGVRIREGYGQTENAVIVANAPGGTARPGSIGTATAGHQVHVIDRDGRELPVGEEGELAIRGRPPTVFAGYDRAHLQTANAFRGQWYVTGDRGRRDPEGCFWFTGRSEDRISLSGATISPVPFERALLEHPGVTECAVVGARGGEALKAFVVRSARAGDAARLELELRYLLQRTARQLEYGREVEFLDELPKTWEGKIRRADLRRLEAGDQAEGGTG